MCFSYLGLPLGVERAYGRPRLGCKGLRNSQKSSFAIYMEGRQTRKGTEQLLERKLFKKVLVLLILFGLFFDTYLDQDPYYLSIVAGPRPKLE